MKGRNSISMTNTITRTMFTCILVNDKVFYVLMTMTRDFVNPSVYDFELITL
jgi:hypothetical protein